jgi:CRISP-associated protein Cas1
MGTVYITQEDSFVGKTDERLQVKFEKNLLLDVPLLKIEGLVIMGRATVSPALITELLDRRIPLTFLTKTGKYLGSLEPPLTKNIFIRSAQWAAAREDRSKAVHVVKGFVRGKLKNYRIALLRAQREHPDTQLESAIKKLDNVILPIDLTDNIDSLRGLEGAGSAAYFGSFNQLIRADGFRFEARRRRPPTDPVNALLSFGYSLLAHDLQSAINIVGFDPYLGYLHTERYGRPSLALDLMEEFRPLVVDAMVLSAVNRKVLVPSDFMTEPLSKAVSLTDDGRRSFLRAYEQKKQSKFKHPVLQKQCTYQEAFEIQARLLGKYLMSETDKYPPLILK